MRPEQADQFTLASQSSSSSDPSKLDGDTSIMSELNPSNNPPPPSSSSLPSPPPPRSSFSGKPSVFSAPFQNSVQSSPSSSSSSPSISSPPNGSYHRGSSVRSSENSTKESGSSALHRFKVDKMMLSEMDGTEDGSIPRLTFSPDTPPTHEDSSKVFSISPSVNSRGGSSYYMDSNGSGGAGLGVSSQGARHRGNSALLNGNSNGLTESMSTSAGNLDVTDDASEGTAAAANHSHSSSFSNEENFECVGEGPESLLESHSENTSLLFPRDASELSTLSAPGDSPGAPPIRRNSWLRTSLRKSPQQSASSPNGETMGHRRWGSFRNSSGSKRVPAVTSSSALANHLYRSSSFHSSGRSSAGDGEEMYSDGSLEDEVIDLTQKVHHLEEKFSVLAENQTDVDDRYVRIKQENAELSTKLFMAEESLRDVELRAEEKLKDEQRRFKDILARSEREKQLQVENYDIRLRSTEKDLEQAKVELGRLKQKLERERQEKSLTRDKLLETERELGTVREDNRALMDAVRKERDNYLLEAQTAQQALLELRKEFELSRKHRLDGLTPSDPHRPGHNVRFNSVESESEAAELKSRLAESEEENRRLKQQNRQLQEANEELNAQILNHGLEEGRHLLTVNRNMGDMGNSLAAEFEAMSQEQLKKALKEQTEVNDQLRTYIDGILLNIVENYPQLLEVKNKSTTPENSLPSYNN